jgi:hypothetical protein
MSRSDVHQEMKEMFGTVISFVDEIPDEWASPQIVEGWVKRQPPR